MALELFKPFIMRKLVQKDVVYNIKKAKTLVEQESAEVWPCWKRWCRSIR